MIVKIYGAETPLKSKANEEIIPKKTEIGDGYNRPIEFKKFSFFNKNDCTIVINNEREIFLFAGLGLNISLEEESITSLRIKEDGVAYTYVAGY